MGNTYIKMKKTLFTLFLTGLLFNSFSQKVEFGVYWFESKNYNLVITNTLEKMQIALVNKKLRIQQNGVAEQRIAPRYSNTPGKVWYEFQTDSCNYDFDISKAKLTLNSFDCKNGKKSSKIVFLKRSFTSLAKWNQQLEELKKKIEIKK